MDALESMKSLVLMNMLRTWIMLTLFVACVVLLFNQGIQTKAKKLLLAATLLPTIPIVANYIESILSIAGFVGNDYMRTSSFFWPWFNLASVGCLLGYIVAIEPQSMRGFSFDSIKHVWFSFEGRISRMEYWLKGIIPAMAIVGIPSILLRTSDSILASVLSILLGLASLWIASGLVVKRLHDTDMSGWFGLIIFIPIIGFLVLVYFVWFLKGTDGPNRFGHDPLLVLTNSSKLIE